MPSRVLATLVTVGILACGCASTAGAEGHRGGPGSGRTVPGGSPATPDATPSEAVAAAAAIAGFRTEVDAAAAGFVGDVDRLQSAVDRGSLLAARSDQLAAQADFDRFRLLQTGDATTASTLDELATDVGAGQTFGGLHAVERDLWTPGLTPAAATADAATDLSGLVAQAPVAEYLLAREVLDPEAIGTTAVSELGWVDGTAIPGREEQYSHLDGVDIAATVSAAHGRGRGHLPGHPSGPLPAGGCHCRRPGPAGCAAGPLRNGWAPVVNGWTSAGRQPVGWAG